MGCDMGTSLRDLAPVVVSVIMAEALFLFSDGRENDRNFDQLTLRFDRATAAKTGWEK